MYENHRSSEEQETEKGKARAEWNKKIRRRQLEIVYFYNGKIYSRDEAMEEFITNHIMST